MRTTPCSWLRLRFLAGALCVTAALMLGCNREPAPKTAPPAPQANAPVVQPPAAQPVFRVTAIDLGNAISADKKVTAPSTTFKPSETIYASVATDGASPNVSLAARWTYEDGQLVSETTQTISPTGPAVTEFHISKPDGWPAGKYKVDVAVNGKAAGTREFSVVE